MPIKVNVVDNNSSVRVRPQAKDNVPTKPDCGIDNARYEALVNKEREERIAADEVLQNTKQNLGFISVEPFLFKGTPYGMFNDETLELLKKFLVNKLEYNSYIYSLSSSNRNIKRYTCPMEIPIDKIEVNFETGVFSLLNSNEHFVTQEQINFWNNKVTAYANQDIEHEGNNILILDKDNYIDENGNIVNEGE